MADAAPSFLAQAIAETPLVVSEDRLQRLKDEVAKTRDLIQLKADLEARLTETNIAIEAATRRTLPDLMDEVGIPKVTIAAEGNNPGFEAEAKPDYYANIPADWPPEKREAGFAWLSSNGHGDLIKTEVLTAFPRGAYAAALEFAAQAKAKGLQPVVKESIHFQTFTSWLKEMVEKHGETPPLDIIGGRVGRIVKLKPLKEKIDGPRRR